MGVIFDETYFNGKGYSSYENFPHFKERAVWIKDNLSGGILEIGSAYGFLIEELNKLGIPIGGIDVSEYAISQVNTSIKDQVKVSSASVITNYYDWIISWNVLDCLNDESDASRVAQVLNTHAKNQLHIIQTDGEEYTKQGYFIREYEYWRSLLPNASIIEEAGFVHSSFPFTKIPLCHGRRSE